MLNKEITIIMILKPCEKSDSCTFPYFTPFSFIQRMPLDRSSSQVSISPTFYEQLYCTKVLCTAFMSLQFQLVFFCRKEIGTKAAHKMLVKMTIAIVGVSVVQIWIKLWWIYTFLNYCKNMTTSATADSYSHSLTRLVLFCQKYVFKFSIRICCQ